LGGNLIRPGNLFIDCEDNDEAKPWVVNSSSCKPSGITRSIWLVSSLDDDATATAS
uniref:Ricin B-type lectin domain-containing protein n=1 Tax=Brugia timori TaxID=42155 RepID=A0A0R3QCS5_9BILA